jgi:hypothetical protein
MNFVNSRVRYKGRERPTPSDEATAAFDAELATRN